MYKLYALLSFFFTIASIGTAYEEESGLRSVGQRCSDDNGQQCESEDLSCSDSLLGFGKRCVPNSNSCFVETAKNFSQTFNHAEWTELVLEKSGLTTMDLIAASAKAGNFEAFQQTQEFQALVNSFNANRPTSALELLQMGTDECRVNAGLDPKQQCTIPYTSFHMELGFIFECHFSLIGYDYDGYSYTALRAGPSIGPQASFQMTAEFGWFFTDNPVEIETDMADWDGISFDVDVLVGAGVGMALYIGIGGAATALDFTVGGGIGGGLGVSLFSIGLLSTIEPTRNPSSTPWPTRTPKTPTPSATPSAKPTP